MPLTLRVTSHQNQTLGPQGVKTFGADGGSIGRRPDNDWVLPDPERFVSGQHAEIACRNGMFYLRDLSVNGTFVNGSSEPIGNGLEQPLNDGDLVRIGDYDISVDLGAAEHDIAGAGAAGSGQWPPGTAEDTRGAPSGAHGLPSTDPLDLFEPGTAQAPPRPAPNVQPDHASSMEDFFQPPPVEQAPQTAGSDTQAPIPDEAGIPEDWDKTGFSAPGPAPAPPAPPAGSDPFGAPGPPAARQAPSEPPARQPPQPGAAPSSAPAGDAASTLAALLTRAGLDPAAARSAAASPDLADTLGAMLNVVLQGMLEVLKARTEIKSEFRVPVTMMQAVENNPLKFSATPQQALQTMLDPRSDAYMDPTAAFSEGFQDIKAHQVAMMAGMRAAFDAVVRRFDPDELSERFERQLKRGALLNVAGKGRYWDMYRDLFDEMTRDADSNFQRLFGDEFARAYEEQMRRLTRARR